jgi:hypothetical protein
MAGVACIALVVVAVLRQGPATLAPATTPVSDVAAGAPPSAPAQQETQPEAGSRKPEAGSRKPEAGPPSPLGVPRGDPERAPRLRAERVEGPSRSVRNSAPAVRTLSVAFPAEASRLARKDLEFRWHAVPGSLYYEVDLVTEDGTSVWHSRVEGTSVRPPDGAKLDAGAKYFVWVKAFLSGGETIKSAAVSFGIGKS